MRVTLTGATGGIGGGLAKALVARGDEVTALTRNPERAAGRLPEGVTAVGWDPVAGPAPADALAGRDAVVNLAGENVSQRWTSEIKQRIRASRELGTRNLVEGLRMRRAAARGAHLRLRLGLLRPARRRARRRGRARPGDDFLAAVSVAWEREALEAEELGMRVAIVRTGIVLDADSGAVATMLTPFKLGVGGPVAGGKQYMPWIHRGRRDRPAARRAGLPRLLRADQRLGTRARDQPRLLARARAGAAPPRVRPDPGRRHQAPLRRHGADRRRTASGWCPVAPPSWATRSAIPTSTRPWARHCASARQPRPSPRGRASTVKRPRRPTA